MNLSAVYPDDVSSNITDISNTIQDNPAYYWNYDRDYLMSFFSSSTYKTYEMFMKCLPYLLIVMVSLSFVGNLLIIIVVLQPRNKGHTLSIYIASLAFADLLINIGYTFANFLIAQGYLEESYSYLDCKLRSLIPNCAEYVSVWTLCIISIERALSVTYPHKIKRLCNINRAKGIIAGTWFISFLISVALTYMREHYEYAGIKRCYVTQEASIILKYFYFRFYSFALFIVPVPTLLICTTIILYKIAKSSKINQNDLMKKKIKSSVTKALINVNIVFILTYSPMCIYLLMESFDYFNNHTTYSLQLDRLFAKTVFGVFMDLNSVLNFFVYFFSGSRFRNDLFQLLSRIKSGHILTAPTPVLDSSDDANHQN